MRSIIFIICCGWSNFSFSHFDLPIADLFATDDEGSHPSSDEELRRWKKKRSTLPKTASKSKCLLSLNQSPLFFLTDYPLGIKPLGIKDGENNQSKNEESKKAGTEKRKPSGDLCPLTFDAEDTELLYHSEYNKQQLGNNKFPLVALVAFENLSPIFRIE